MIKSTLTCFILAAFVFPSTAFSPWLVRRLRRTVEIQRQLEAEEAQVKPRTNHHHSAPDKPPDVHSLLKVWEEERQILKHFEHGIVNDSNLTNLVSVVKKPKHYINIEFREKEKHRHNSLLDEIVHSIDTDPYLTP
mmetsp:Transcript_16056/g.30564  ORF Transcript_16056/g.30564 Transcript_16056/m.30564 type:complete len:136 (-) Transcript_16056:152-559(-)